MRNGDLGHRNLTNRTFVTALVHSLGGVVHETPAHLKLDTRFADLPLDLSVFALHLSERLLLGVGRFEEHELNGALADADGAHAVVDTATSETALEDLEAAAFTEDQVLGGNDDLDGR